jgi:pyruvate dehydrogenase E1 component beta subunit
VPSYLEAVNGALVRAAAPVPDLVQFGENIAQGSRICGLARGLGGRLLTVGNCENTHVGAGLGMMLAGGRALLVVKQLDFLLLALDQLVNTTSLLRAPGAPLGPGSFTILAIVCDQGWQGPQSSFHDLAGLCALARVNGYFLNGAADARRVLEAELGSPGFRLIAVSQDRFGQEALALEPIEWAPDHSEARYSNGQGAVIASFGFALPRAWTMAADLERREGKAASVFQINPVMPYQWTGVTAAAVRARRLIVLDDGKGPVSLAHKLVCSVLRVAPDCQVTMHTRERQHETGVNADRFVVAA